MRGDLSRQAAEERDAADPLAGLRDRFVITDPELIYLDGNSLGRLPAATPQALDRLVRQEWGTDLVRSWSSWIDWGRRLGDRLAAHALGARPGEVVVSDSTSVNLYKLAAAALDANPGRRVILVDAEEFPTDRYLLQGLAAQRGLTVRPLPSDLDEGLSAADVRQSLDDQVALVVLSAVSYRSGTLLDLAAVNAAAREVGAYVLWDLSHAAGSVPVELTASGADLAVGCTYKYLNGGPGAPAFLYVRQELQARLRQPIWGWFGQRDQFRMGPEYDPAPDIDRFLVGTPPILSLAALDPALDVLAEAGIDRLRAKGVGLGELMVDLADAWLTPLGFTLASPREAHRRGSHICLAHPDALRISRALISEAKVVGDFRVPDRLRLGPAPLYTRYVDVWDGMARLRDLVARGGHEQLPQETPRVT
ncbi:kynureninase [Micromonospora sagamiensis]|uniref:Kynureninase n=1 Tax=Micromonospora sagamiensis TaxID=47875 RepID=A0A562WFS7_9ACTN|nr:kynureninase [Micromonospora sagamiensis]TWJ29120.1 kynureninase [Micromonospora sagamiensis]BCL17855.1 kynureninase [Micromonospora sagamiensis]